MEHRIGGEGKNYPQRNLNTFRQINVVPTMFSGHSAIKMVLNSKKKYTVINNKKYITLLGFRAPSFCPHASLSSSWQPHTVLPLIVLSSGVRGLHWSLRDPSEVLLQSELSIRIPTTPGEGERMHGFSCR